MMMIPIIIVAIEAVPKGLGKRLEELETKGRIKNIPTTAL